MCAQVQSVTFYHFRLEFLHTFHVGPSSPMYYQYTFDEGVDSVLIKVESPDEICMIVSVQDVQVCSGNPLCAH